MMNVATPEVTLHPLMNVNVQESATNDSRTDENDHFASGGTSDPEGDIAPSASSSTSFDSGLGPMAVMVSSGEIVHDRADGYDAIEAPLESDKIVAQRDAARGDPLKKRLLRVATQGGSSFYRASRDSSSRRWSSLIKGGEHVVSPVVVVSSREVSASSCQHKSHRHHQGRIRQSSISSAWVELLTCFTRDITGCWTRPLPAPLMELRLEVRTNPCR